MNVPPKNVLAATKMIASIDEQIATVLGILVLGKNPQDFLPGAYVQFLRIDGNELADDIIDSEEIRGCNSRPAPPSGRETERSQSHRC